ncbi:uncharacterized protein LOC126906792 isoform X2 [Daktulosphaira vitifoliae]|uniref:uncharacterized protein LOC126906792 isoform X2 n=1 Tax=Daktulosphaira vitifoliae TaxID=58002 RepID=UPI0021AABF68|nr:uncharacterized protein LOC126906792 isoform X2 [Daktulosphaira vitifoliae]
MFSLKLLEIFVLLLYLIVVFVEAPTTSTKKKAAIINSLCQNDGWQHLTDLEYVKYGTKTYMLDNINIIVDKSKSNKKVHAAALILVCTYANDLKKIFNMIIDYCHECKKVLYKKKNPYECTIDLLSITKKITLLATVMKESLMSLDALYGTPLKNTTDDYILYCYLSHLQKIENSIIHETLSQDNPKTCEKILENINYIFNKMKEDINIEIKEKSKKCFFKPEIVNEMSQDLKTVNKIKNNQKKNYSFEYFNEKIDNDIKKIVIEKCFNLGFYFNTKIQMIDVPLPKEVLDNKQMKRSNTSYLIEIEKKKKTETGVAELLDFLKNALNSDKNLNVVKLTGQNLNAEKSVDVNSVDKEYDDTELIYESLLQNLDSSDSSELNHKKLKL